ncbi:MAG: hypothetical protein JSW05_02730 [Candidatus Thorarchaeota archaeon]|nr:MAG: hypothetical protein JSW05_02730 [Candidatus Thorarchaeota archaeon]
MEVSFTLPGPGSYEGNYNCMLFTIQTVHYSNEVFITIRDPAIVAAALGICIPGIYFTRRLAHQSRAAPVKDLALSSGFAMIFISMYCVYRSNLTYELLSVGVLALLVFVFLPIFAREAELVGLAEVLTSQSGKDVPGESMAGPLRIPRRYGIYGNALALAAFLMPFLLLVQSSFGETSWYQVISLLSAPVYRDQLTLRVRSLWDNIYSVDLLFFVLFFCGARVVFAFGILRYWRGLTSRTRLVLVGAFGILVPGLVAKLAIENQLSGDLFFSVPLPILFIMGLIIITKLTPRYVESPQISEIDAEVAAHEKRVWDSRHEIDVPLLYTLKSRAVLALSRLRRRRSDSESEE